MPLRSKLLQKIGYGWDQEGKVTDNQQQNIEDTQQPSTTHETPHNRVDLSSDVEAEKEFPTLNRPTNRFPSRRPR